MDIQNQLNSNQRTAIGVHKGQRPLRPLGGDGGDLFAVPKLALYVALGDDRSGLFHVVPPDTGVFAALFRAHILNHYIIAFIERKHKKEGAPIWRPLSGLSTKSTGPLQNANISFEDLQPAASHSLCSHTCRLRSVFSRRISSEKQISFCRLRTMELREALTQNLGYFYFFDELPAFLYRSIPAASRCLGYRTPLGRAVPFSPGAPGCRHRPGPPPR